MARIVICRHDGRARFLAYGTSSPNVRTNPEKKNPTELEFLYMILHDMNGYIFSNNTKKQITNTFYTNISSPRCVDYHASGLCSHLSGVN